MVVTVVAGGGSGMLEWWLWRVAVRWQRGYGVEEVVGWCDGWYDDVGGHGGDNDEMVMGMMVGSLEMAVGLAGDGGGVRNLKMRGERILVARFLIL
ncbi:hypothetical protein Tco_0248805 [Tanacetum coccineum]